MRLSCNCLFLIYLDFFLVHTRIHLKQCKGATIGDLQKLFLQFFFISPEPCFESTHDFFFIEIINQIAVDLRTKRSTPMFYPLSRENAKCSWPETYYKLYVTYPSESRARSCANNSNAGAVYLKS